MVFAAVSANGAAAREARAAGENAPGRPSAAKIAAGAEEFFVEGRGTSGSFFSIMKGSGRRDAGAPGSQRKASP